VDTGRSPKLKYLFYLTLIPLLIGVFRSGNEFRTRITIAVKQHPEIVEALGTHATVDEFIAALPGGRIEGALHPRTTWVHWLYGIVSAILFWALLLLLFPLGRANSFHLWSVGLLVGTVGILVLLGFQWVAAEMQGRVIMGANPIVILYAIIWFIGYSYSAAMDSGNGFWASLAGFTFGIGLTEELIKLIPLALSFRKSVALDLRGAIVWGMAMGIGFGVSEGIHYAGAYYNGVADQDPYLVRFISCVALHTVWSGMAAAFAWSKREEFEQAERWYGILPPLAISASGSIVLHGLYDTLLKRDFEALAFLVAVLSFTLFFVVLGRKIREEKRGILGTVS
jgi:RsiW-degrading membrane proteinase PrsW (M82 family)